MQGLLLPSSEPRFLTSTYLNPEDAENRNMYIHKCSYCWYLQPTDTTKLACQMYLSGCREETVLKINVCAYVFAYILAQKMKNTTF